MEKFVRSSVVAIVDLEVVSFKDDTPRFERFVGESLWIVAKCVSTTDGMVSLSDIGWNTLVS